MEEKEKADRENSNPVAKKSKRRRILTGEIVKCIYIRQLQLQPESSKQNKKEKIKKIFLFLFLFFYSFHTNFLFWQKFFLG